VHPARLLQRFLYCRSGQNSNTQYLRLTVVVLGPLVLIGSIQILEQPQGEKWQ